MNLVIEDNDTEKQLCGRDLLTTLFAEMLADVPDSQVEQQVLAYEGGLSIQFYVGAGGGGSARTVVKGKTR